MLKNINPREYVVLRTDQRGVVELDPADPRSTVCSECGRGWDDTVATAWTPVPAGRCPFEYDHYKG